MNIFVTDKDPKISARNLDDLRVNKMITESIQMLAYAIDIHGGTQLPLTKAGKPYKVKGPHRKHPCTVWAAQTRSNYLWLLDHTFGLCEEFEYRHGKAQAGRSNLVILSKGMNVIPEGDLMPFHNSSTNHKHISDTISAYKLEMAFKWARDKRKPKWTRRGKPSWYKG